jgi:prepilin signal peptidase PulO-like enzyme (type II secretory pathway)
LVLAAVLQAFANRVPNALTIPAILAGWLFPFYAGATHRALGAGAMLQASVFASLLALIILLPWYRTRGLGAGCVKAQMAFGAWTGCALPLLPALVLTASATIAGIVFSCLLLRMTVAEMPEEEQQNYLFPAQITISAVAVAGVLVCWIISCPA